MHRGHGAAGIAMDNLRHEPGVSPAREDDFLSPTPVAIWKGDQDGLGTGGGAVLPPASALQPTTGRLQQGRRNHTSTLLATGGVLVAGGFIQGTTVALSGM